MEGSRILEQPKTEAAIPALPVVPHRRMLADEVAHGVDRRVQVADLAPVHQAVLVLDLALVDLGLVNETWARTYGPPVDQAIATCLTSSGQKVSVSEIKSAEKWPDQG